MESAVPEAFVIGTARYADGVRDEDLPVGETASPARVVTAEDLRRFADTFGDLANVELMSRAWE